MTIGVTVWSVAEPLVVDFEIDVDRYHLRKDGSIKPVDSIGKKLVPKSLLEPKIRELIGDNGMSISRVAVELGVSVTTVRRVCRTLKIGSYKPLPVDAIVSRSSQAAYGWDRYEGILQRHPEEWAWVCKIFEWRGQGMSLNQIAKELVKFSVPTKNGGSWHRKTVSQIIVFNCRYIFEV